MVTNPAFLGSGGLMGFNAGLMGGFQPTQTGFNPSNPGLNPGLFGIPNVTQYTGLPPLLLYGGTRPDMLNAVLWMTSLQRTPTDIIPFSGLSAPLFPTNPLFSFGGFQSGALGSIPNPNMNFGALFQGPTGFGGTGAQFGAPFQNFGGSNFNMTGQQFPGFGSFGPANPFGFFA